MRHSLRGSVRLIGYCQILAKEFIKQYPGFYINISSALTQLNEEINTRQQRAAKHSCTDSDNMSVCKDLFVLKDKLMKSRRCHKYFQNEESAVIRYLYHVIRPDFKSWNPAGRVTVHHSVLSSGWHFLTADSLMGMTTLTRSDTCSKYWPFLIGQIICNSVKVVRLRQFCY